MNVLQGKFYSTAFRVKDEADFEHNPAVVELLKHIETYSHKMNGFWLYCITSKGDEPGTRLRVTRPAILGLLVDTGQNYLALEDTLGWITTLQNHLHPDDGIILMNQGNNGEAYQTYIAADCAGWTRK